jgi:hypothetical protein
MLEHHALVYASDAELVERMAPFIAHGVERGEAVLTVTTPARIRRLRNALHGSARDAEFVSCRDWYSSPVEALRRYRGFIEERLATGAPWIRIVGEPVWDGCSAAEIETWKRYESMINISLATTPATIVCPYDAGALPAAIVRGAQRTHPSLSGSDGPVACPDYEDPEALLLGRSRR